MVQKVLQSRETVGLIVNVKRDLFEQDMSQTSEKKDTVKKNGDRKKKKMTL